MSMIDLPGPYAPMTDLMKSLRTLEQLPESDVIAQGSLELVREWIKRRKADTLPDDPQ